MEGHYVGREKEKDVQAFSFESRLISTQDKAYCDSKRASHEEIRHDVGTDAGGCALGGGQANAPLIWVAKATSHFLIHFIRKNHY